MKHKIMTLIGSLVVVLFSATNVYAKIITLNWGDTLSKLATKYNTTINTLQLQNNIVDPDKIYAGDKLIIPDQDKVNYWVERIKNNSNQPLSEEELKQIPEESWAEIEPQIVNFLPPEDSLGGGEPQVLQTIVCRGAKCDQFNKQEALGFSVVSRYRTTLRSSMTSSQLTVPVSTLSTFDGHTLTMSDLGESVYLTIEPGANNEEIVKCTTIASSQWATCTRGLAFYGTSESSVSANQKTHNAGSIVVMSNVHYVYEQLLDKDTNQTLSNDFTVSSSTATSTLRLGNGATTYDKCIKVYNGSSNNPKFCYVESQSKWLLYNDGVNSYDITAGGSGLAAGKGTLINSGKIDLDITNTSTQSLGFIGSQPRVELSTNGGITRSSDGLSVDQTANYSWTGNHSFATSTVTIGAGTVTSTPQAYGVPQASSTKIIAGGWIGASSTGDIIYYNGTDLTRLAIGTSSTQSLRVNSTLTAPSWVTSTPIAGVTSTARNIVTTQVYTHNLGVIPSLIQIRTESQCDNTGTADACWSIGEAANVSDQNAIYNQKSSSGSSVPGISAGEMVRLVDVAGNLDAAAALSAITATTFTLNWTTNVNAGTTRYLLFTVFP